MQLLSIIKNFKNQEDCISYLESKRWPKGVICPYCKSDVTHKHIRGGHQCNKCHKSFSVTVGTIFHKTHIPLQEWFLLIALMQNAKKGLSACQASRDLGIRRVTVWSMMHRIRKAMKQDSDLLCGIIEVDETYTCKKDDYDNKPSLRGRGCNKQTVVGCVSKQGKVS